MAIFRRDKLCGIFAVFLVGLSVIAARRLCTLRWLKVEF